MEDVICLTVGCDLSRDRSLHYFAEAAEQADHPICFRDAVRGFTVFAKQDDFRGLPRAGVKPRPYLPLYQSYYTVFRPLPQ
jgi:hypothetical protein